MENEMICPKCYGKECTKSRIVRNKQRYRCKRCKYNFTRSTCWKYSDEVRQKAIKLYLEGNGFKMYDIIPSYKHLIGKSHTFNVERMKRLLSHYLSKFSRISYCWHRSFFMISFSVYLVCMLYIARKNLYKFFVIACIIVIKIKIEVIN